MRNRGFFVIAMLLSCLSNLSSAADADTNEGISRAKDAIVTVVAYDISGKEYARGSGVFAGEGVVLTARHMLAGATRAIVTTAGRAECAVSGVVADDIEGDLVLLSVKAPGAVTAQYSEEYAIRGDGLSILYRPEGRETKVFEETVSKIDHYDGFGTVIAIRQAAAGGLDGAVAVDAGGRVAGLVTVREVAGEPRAFCVAWERPKSLPVGEVRPLSAWGGSRRETLGEAFRAGLDAMWGGADDEAIEHFTKAVATDQKNSRAWFSLGLCHERRGGNADAAKAYEQCVRSDPADGIALYHLGQVFLEMRQWEAAYESYARATQALDIQIEAHPDNPWLCIHAGNGLCEIGKLLLSASRSAADRTTVKSVEAFLLSIEIHNEALKINPRSALAYYGVGRGYTWLGKYEEAYKYYRKSVELDNENPDVLHNMAVAAGELKLFDEAVELHKREVALTPDDAVAHYSLGVAYGTLDMYEEAAAQYRTALQIAPDYPYASLNLSIALSNIGRNEEAIAVAEAAVRLHGDSAMAHRRLGNALRRAERYDEAIAECGRAVKLDPVDPVLHYYLGLAYADAGRYEEAAEAYKASIRLDGSDSDSLGGLGWVLCELSRFADALNPLKKALELDPEATWVLRNTAWAYSETGQIEKAVETIEKALLVEPDEASNHRRAGKIYKKQARYDEAIKAYRKALELGGDDAYLLSEIGYIYDKMCKFPEAKEYLEKAIKTDPEYSYAHRMLSYVLRSLGRCEEATVEARLSVKLDGDSHHTHEALATALEEAGKWKESLAEFKKAAAIDDKCDRVYSGIAHASLMMDMNEEAIQAALEAIKLNPDSNYARYYLGWAYVKTGNLSGAKEQYEILRKRDDEIAGYLFKRMND